VSLVSRLYLKSFKNGFLELRIDTSVDATQSGHQRVISPDSTMSILGEENRLTTITTTTTTTITTPTTTTAPTTTNLGCQLQQFE
jgi:hypothetical protein